MNPKQSIFSLQFSLLCLSGFLFFGSFNMIIPELPSYLESMGGGEYKGLIVSLFTLTAGLSRPLSGKLADKVGRIPVMVVGALVSGVAALFYPFATTIIGFFLLRFFHGFSTGFKPTGTSAYVADIIPYQRRGEAMGYIGFFSSTGMAAGLAIGPYIASNISLNAMFFTSCAFAVGSVAVLIGMKESLEKPERLSTEHFKIRFHEVFEPKVIAPSVVMVLSVYAFGTMLTVIPDLSDSIGLSNRGTFFTIFTLSSLLVRIIAGKASDRYGRVPILKIGCLMVFASMVLLANVANFWVFATSAVIFGFGVGICSPTVLAWTIDLCDDKRRGRGIATMYIALEIGIGLGALVTGWIYSNDLGRIPYVFYLSALFVVVAFIFLYSNRVRSLTPKINSNE